jgi:hypothetical protein
MLGAKAGKGRTPTNRLSQQLSSESLMELGAKKQADAEKLTSEGLEFLSMWSGS